MKSVVLVSGGLDSAVALAMQDDPVEALTVDYGQRHQREIHAAAKLAAHYGVPWRCLNITAGGLFAGASSALLNRDVEIPEGHAEEPDATYVPARNTLLLSLAAVRAEILGARKIVIGANADDADAYPDCRAAYLEAFRDVLVEGTISGVWVDAPLLYRPKGDVIAEAERLGVPMQITWSCYKGSADPCGRCGACVSRGDA